MIGRRRGTTVVEKKGNRSSVKVWAKDDWKRLSGKASNSYVCPDVDAFDAQLQLEGGTGKSSGAVLSSAEAIALRTSVEVVESALDPHWKAENAEKEKRKCAETITELLNTEIDYFRDLLLVSDVFLKPIREEEILNKYEVVSLFSNIEALAAANSAVVQALASAVSGGGNVLQEIGKTMKAASVSLGSSYSIYCANQPNIPSRITEYQAEEKLATFLKRCYQVKECRKLGLQDFLIMPLQRLCKYPLLVKQLLASVPKSSTIDYIAVAESLTCINKAVDQVNGRVRQVENVTKLVEIALSLKNTDEYREKITSSPTREFLLEADVLLSGSERHLFLFSDSLLLCKRVKQEWCPARGSSASSRDAKQEKPAPQAPYIAYRLIPIKMMVVTDLKDSDEKQSSFELAEVGRKIYVVECKNRQQKRVWLGKLQQAIAALGSATEAEKRSSVKALRKLQLKGDSLVKHQEMLVPPVENKSPSRLHRRSMWLAAKLTGGSSSSGLVNAVAAAGGGGGQGQGLQEEVNKLHAKNQLLQMQLDAAKMKTRVANDVLTTDGKKAAKLVEREKQREEDLERIVELEEKVDEMQAMINQLTKASAKAERRAKREKKRARDYKRKFLALRQQQVRASREAQSDSEEEFSEDSSSES
mmetsp:Transcript_15925/g.62222  ORF Transcript_15925/g.62222 Transcript_15925/m.62222 type:complete len:645 (+) Transcript_15925:38-1972(+)